VEGGEVEAGFFDGVVGDLFPELAVDFNLGGKEGKEMDLHQSGFFPVLTGNAGLLKDFLH